MRRLHEIYLYYCKTCRTVTVHDSGLSSPGETETPGPCAVCKKVTMHKPVALDLDHRRDVRRFVTTD